MAEAALTIIGILATIASPVLIIILAFIDFIVMHATRQPATAYALLALAVIYMAGGISMISVGNPLFMMPGYIALLFGVMQFVWGLWTIRQYRKNPGWGNL